VTARLTEVTSLFRAKNEELTSLSSSAVVETSRSITRAISETVEFERLASATSSA
jgi:hypothetical protein